MWDLKTGKEIRTLVGHSDNINAVSVTTNGDYVISASKDRTLKLWDLKTGEEVSSFNGDSSFGCVTFSPDSSNIVAGDKSGKVCFLLFENEKNINDFNKEKSLQEDSGYLNVTPNK